MSASKDLISLKSIVSDLLTENDAVIETVFTELVSLHNTIVIKRAFAPKFYAISSGSKAAMNFLLAQITSRQAGETSATNAKERFSNFAAIINENIVPKVGPLILAKNIDFILKGIEQKYSLFSTLFNERKLSILRINNTNLNCNALCYTRQLTAGVFNTINYELVLFHEREGADWHPAFIFLHELGHILQIEISRNPAIPPKSFVKMLNSYQGPRIEQDKDSAELFADAFAFAMIYLFEWKEFEPQ